MSKLTVIETWSELNEDTKKTFRSHFSTDDWTFIVIGKKSDQVAAKALELHPTRCDFSFMKIGKEFWCVTYHS